MSQDTELSTKESAKEAASKLASSGGFEEITDPATKRILQKHLVGFLLGSTGFFASLIRGFNKVCTRSIPTMGVSFSRSQDRFILYWNPDFVREVEETGNKKLDGLGDTRMRNVLVHEVMHVALKHTTTRRREPHFIWNVACDLAINSMICGTDKHGDGLSSLPEGGLIPGRKVLKKDGQPYKRGEDDDFACDLAQAVEEMPPGLLSEVYFESLMEAFRDKIEEAKKKQKSRRGQKQQGGGGGGSEQQEQGSTSEGDGEGGEQPGPLDDHELWDERGAEPGDEGEASNEDREYVEQRVRDLLRRAVASAESHSDGWGSVPQKIRAAIKSYLGNEVDWRKILEMWAHGRIRAETSHTIRRINRRYPMVHPGAKRNHRPLLLVAKDQSGSVPDEAVALFYAELDALSRDVDFDQVAFDTHCGDVTRWFRGSRPEPTRERCGGTDFNAPIRLMEGENQGRWDGIVMLTDGECCKPDPSPVSRIWVICPGHKLMFQPDAGELVIELTGDRSGDDPGVIG